MPFQPGHAKKGGRTKGSKNKDRLGVRKIVEEILGQSLPASLVQLANEAMEPEFRAHIYTGLMPYCYPKLTATEFSFEDPSEKDSEPKQSLKELSAAQLAELSKKVIGR